VDPARFDSVSLVSPQRWNRYSYGKSNPLAFVDVGGLDVVYVNMARMAYSAGHSAIMTVHSDGSVTYSRMGPATAGRPYDVGEVKTSQPSQMPKVEFTPEGVPTSESYAALAGAVAVFESGIEGVQLNPEMVSFLYFKSSPSETAALDQYIQQHTAKSTAKTLGKYLLIGNSCRDYAVGGLIAGGQIGTYVASNLSVVPNIMYLQLSIFANAAVWSSAGSTSSSWTWCIKGTKGCGSQ
jgi:hypothetical protein